LTFTSGSILPTGDLSIVLTSGGEQVDFDNVTLSATTASPEPASLTLLAIGLGLMIFVFRRR